MSYSVPVTVNLDATDGKAAGSTLKCMVVTVERPVRDTQTRQIMTKINFGSQYLQNDKCVMSTFCLHQYKMKTLFYPV